MIPQATIEFDLSSKCTRSCSFCAPGIPSGRRESGIVLDVQHHQDVIDDLSRHAVPGRWIIYCGHGEPLLHPGALDMIEAATTVAGASVAVYTNGDPLTATIVDALSRLGVYIVWDCYENDETSWKVPRLLASYDPERALVMDHVCVAQQYYSRCGAIFKAAMRVGYPCMVPSGKMFLAAEGHWLLCCHDYAHKTAMMPGSVPSEVNRDPQFRALVESLSRGCRSETIPCQNCEHPGGCSVGLSYPRLQSSRFL